VSGSDPPSRRALAALHYLQDRFNYRRTYPATSSEAHALKWYFIKRSLGWPVDWPWPMLEGRAGGVNLAAAMAGVDSLAAQGFAGLTGAVILAPGSGIALSEAGQIITVTNSQPAGLSSLVLFDQTLGGDAASIDTGANGIAQTAIGLLVHIVARTTQAVALSTVTMRLNGDSSAVYDRSEYHVTNATVSGSNTLAQTQWVMQCAGASIQAGSFTTISLVLPGYAGTVAHKAGIGNGMVSDSAAANNLTETRSLRWRNTAAVNQFTLAAGGGNLLAGSRLTIFGLL
jgi:hypothetical protein